MDTDDPKFLGVGGASHRRYQEHIDELMNSRITGCNEEDDEVVQHGTYANYRYDGPAKRSATKKTWTRQDALQCLNVEFWPYHPDRKAGEVPEFDCPRTLAGRANPVLKQAIEDIAVQAALERAFATVQIRSTVHVTTVDEFGQRFDNDPHITIECGGITGHVYCTGFAYSELPPYWYSDMQFSHVKWEDRTPSTQASYPASPVVEQTSVAGIYYAGHEPNPPSPPFPQWVARPAYVAAPGVEYQW
ncbi:hypothetical protein N0V84_008198 [Fusarium piperis]|uniref:Uncharacterized protein n=1 Tax=Fusarium piperis TaxID=1435070 RepID=A0A9W8W8T1_9HYPO|nr:hypothetical protein N0V84_008198 [Fusarium piperis]